MSLRVSLLFALLCILVGVYAGYCIFHKPVNPIVASSEKSVEKKSGLIKKYAPPKKEGGAPILIEEEVYKSESSLESKKESEPRDNLILTLNEKLHASIMVSPLKNLWLGAEYQSKEIVYKIGYSTRIF
jgi:hypothetical protein